MMYFTAHFFMLLFIFSKAYALEGDMRFIGMLKSEIINKGLDCEPIMDFKLDCEDSEEISFKSIKVQKTKSFEAKFFCSGKLKTLKGQCVQEKVLIPVLKREIESDIEISDDMLDFIQLNRWQIKKEHLIDKKNILGMRAKRYLKPGMPILTQDLYKVQLIKRGDIVKAFFISGGVVIEFQAVSQESGCKGDAIKVKNLYNNQLLDAVIVSKGIVRCA